ncbi:MAG: dephospho-CoA kinase [Lentisphaeria bacterium]|nr:dephospho-CoA kinase [Lentisphaeria bacterium]
MIIGITGIFGCGKSTCVKLLKKFNLDVLDADIICHQIYAEKDPGLIALLKKRWGAEILTENGEINRKKIAEIVFTDKKEMDFLSETISPIIRKRILSQISSYREKNLNLFVEIPLLFEENYDKYLDKTVTIYASMDKRISNLANRNYSIDDIIARDKQQLPIEKKCELADFVIINNGSIELLENELKILIDNLKI